MASSPPVSPGHPPSRPMSAIARPTHRSTSRLSMSSKTGAPLSGSRASDEDTRTAVKVAVRVRPPLKPTDPGFDLIPQRFQRSMVQTTSDTSISIDSPQGRKLFVFDRVFGSDVSQEGIWDYLSDSVTAFTQGYNVSLLAYGQSGAGKSYTMGTSGPGEQMDEDLMGVIPRAATALFEKLDTSKINLAPAPNPKANRNSLSHLKTPRGLAQQNSLGDRSWSLKATYVEIYNEQLRDLLVSDNTPASERSNVAIREDTKGNIILTGLRQVDINSTEDLMNALSFGSSIRQTDATAINAKSSRSHAVFSLNLVQRKSGYQAPKGAEKRFSVPIEAMTGNEVSITTDSKLHFVDLAGSERLKNTGAQGERAKEGISINGGLAALGKVISQLSSRNPGSHVSYRDSRLTRLLQDSLGGNAITYMIACVTPAEFHLSETLNTVQYAQRARAIQSKPRIQQLEESDKQAVIDRLKAEVAFLREQIRNASQRNGGLSPGREIQGMSERSEKANEREVELQNQLLDTQESYNALSERHARLISEMARARERESGELHGDDLHGGSADDRLNRSNSFAQAVEQVVLEYEKTIQSLEQSLSSTRGTLSTTEANLLEKESKCAYVETINSQLHNRLQKLTDREASTENYLRDLESKLDGHTSGDEKNTVIIMDLRKEIARIRENEASCEDYISTLEERLAEADQDAELMQREIDRLEQVVERQRSLGKLDSLLHELDHVQEAKQPQPETEVVGSVASRRRPMEHSRSQSHVSRHSQMEDPIPEDDEDEGSESKIDTVEEEAEEELGSDSRSRSRSRSTPNGQETAPSPAQTKYVADKLENVTQELFDLRVEHENTINQYDVLSAQYEEAMRKISDLQDAVDEARHVSNDNRASIISAVTPFSPTDIRPNSFMSGKSQSLKDGPRSSMSRSLSSELSSAMDSPATAATSHADSGSEDENATTKPDASTDDLTLSATDQWAAELERLKILAGEREMAERELAERYAQLELKHSETLDIVEELKTEVHKARAVEVTSPRTSTPVIRRKSSQNVMIIDRAHRSFAALRNIAAENFQGHTDTMQNFELNLNSAMHELHVRSQRIQELEADVASTKKEMETKMTIITGLTRERSSLKSTPMDMAMVATLRDQLEQSERQINSMRESHAAREQELAAELETLRQSVGASASRGDGEGATPAQEEQIAKLQAELADWENKHKYALEGLEKTEKEMRDTIKQLEEQIESVNTKLIETQGEFTSEKDEALREAEKKHESLARFLREEIDEYKIIINNSNAKVAEAEAAHQAVRAELEEITKAHGEAVAEAEKLRALITSLEEKLSAHEHTSKSSEDGLEELKAAHAKELAELRTREQKGYEEQVEVLLSEHADTVQRLEGELAESRDDLMQVAAHMAYALGVDINTQKLTQRIDGLVADRKALTEEKQKANELESHLKELSVVNEHLSQEVETAKKAMADLLSETSDTIPSDSITAQVTAVKHRVSDLQSQSKKNSRLVEELEEQLQHNFDEAQMTNNRLSTLQSERNAQLEEAMAGRIRAQSELESLREEYNSLVIKFNEMTSSTGEIKRSDSNSTIRKTASVVSLPSPPPAIPLPPLPMGATGSTSPTGTAPTSPTMGRPMSKDTIGISQLTEDQEARIRTIEKHLYAERQLTQTLEEALTDLEKQSNKVKADCDAWKKRAQELEGEVKELKDRPATEAPDPRWSVQAVEEERKKRQAAELARKQLEDRMNAINKGRKKKGSSLNCF
ncbi:kinesin [Stachybotrys elegans]|uniref:Kinesin n=1 Tax=Stachybotrys elegans TaxID=80388 RepID=A0A8K0SJA3_9HYPO|nr:kinesin [Stachybotrys elegans]